MTLDRADQCVGTTRVERLLDVAAQDGQILVAMLEEVLKCCNLRSNCGGSDLGLGRKLIDLALLFVASARGLLLLLLAGGRYGSPLAISLELRGFRFAKTTPQRTQPRSRHLQQRSTALTHKVVDS